MELRDEPFMHFHFFYRCLRLRRDIVSALLAKPFCLLIGPLALIPHFISHTLRLHKGIFRLLLKLRRYTLGYTTGEVDGIMRMLLLGSYDESFANTTVDAFTIRTGIEVSLFLALL